MSDRSVRDQLLACFEIAQYVGYNLDELERTCTHCSMIEYRVYADGIKEDAKELVGAIEALFATMDDPPTNPLIDLVALVYDNLIVSEENDGFPGIDITRPLTDGILMTLAQLGLGELPDPLLPRHEELTLRIRQLQYHTPVQWETG